MSKKVFVTMSGGAPVKAYADEMAAKQAVAANSAAKRRFEELWDKEVQPHTPLEGLSSTKVRDDKHPYAGGDGFFYTTQKMALYAKKKEEFYKRKDVLACQKANTGEEYYKAVDFVE